MTTQNDVGAVAIGRNEGVRLERCLAALEDRVGQIVYVDSGSTDGSLALARSMGAEVLELDTTVPFTAARARNAGLERLKTVAPEARFVHFVDGDCEVRETWVTTARDLLESRPKVAAVAGRRRERYPDATRWNRLTDEEWAGAGQGEVKSVGGDALMRIAALEAVGGFNPDLIAGEEPELCVRLRANGWTIWRLADEMTLHDADMTRFSQWWQRARRAGYTYAEGVAMHGKPPERHNVNRLRRTLFWGGMLPLAILLGTLVTPWALLGVLIWPAQVVRLAARGQRLESAVFLMLAKFAELQGVVTWGWRRVRQQRSELIEYK